MILGHERAINPGDEGFLTVTRGQAASQVKRDCAFSTGRSMANSSGFSAARNASPKNAAFTSGQPASKGEAGPSPVEEAGVTRPRDCRTSVLDRMCGSLCDAILGGSQLATIKAGVVASSLAAAKSRLLPLVSTHLSFREIGER
jgi:hypothetical protein